MFEFIEVAIRLYRKLIKRRHQKLLRHFYSYARHNWLLDPVAHWFAPYLDTRPVVFSLVANNALFDSRVLKEAAALESDGYRVIVFCLRNNNLPEFEIVNGIEFWRSKLFFSQTNLDNGLREYVVGLFGKAAPELERVLRKIAIFDREIFNDFMKLKFASIERRKHFESDEALEHLLASQKELEGEYRNKKLEKAMFEREHKTFLLSYLYATNFLSHEVSVIPDVIHAHDIYTLAAALGHAKLSGAKVVYDAHEIETERVPPLSSTAKKFVDVAERHWLNIIDDMVVVSESIADFYSKRFTKKRPTSVVNSPDFAVRSQSDSLDIRKLANLNSDQKVLVYVGIVGGVARGLHLVCEALVKLQDFHLVVLGPRHIEKDNWLTSTAHSFGVGARVHLLSPVDSKSVVSTIRSANVGIIAIQDASLSYRYCLPNKLFEMAFAGLPLCVSNLPEMAKFVKRFNVGVVMDDSKPDTIADAVKFADENKSRFMISSDKLDEMQKEYGWPTQVAKLKLLYDALNHNK